MPARHATRKTLGCIIEAQKHRDTTLMTRASAHQIVLFAAFSMLSCTSTSASQPVPSLARSIDAQSSFQLVRERWMLSTWEERLVLEPQLEAFRMRHPSDPLARLAEAYLALLALQRDERPKAMALARRVRSGPAGNTRDLGTLVDGASLARAGEPEAALQLLDPLVGKMIDTFAQDLLHETVVTTAVHAHRWYQAVVYMNEWIRSANEADLPAVRERLEALLVEFPPAALETALRAMGATRQGDIWERELRETLAMRLAKVAMDRSDPNLARSVLETSRTIVAGDELGTLAQLATSGGRAPRIVSARVGWIAETASRSLGGRSAQAVAGALEVFKPDRTLDLGSGQPTVDPPVMILRDVPPDGSRQEALDDLAHEGVSLIVGGYDPTGAAELAAYAESHSLAAVLLVAPVPAPANPRFSFVLGEPEPAWTNPTASRATSQVDPEKSARIAVGEPPDQPLAYGCDRKAARIGETAFPATAWKSQAVEAIVVEGPAWCARQVLQDLHTVRFFPRVLLGLEAREAAPPSADHVFVATCGHLDSNHETVRAWRASSGNGPTWFQALGRDAALLAHDAVDPLPRDTFTNVRDVMTKRAEIQARLARAQALLWTSETKGFAGQRVLARDVRWIANGDRGGQ